MTHTNSARPVLAWLWISAVVLVLDQVSKWLAVANLRVYEEHPVFPSFNISLVYNNGAAWSLLSDASGWQRWLFALIAATMSVVIVVWMRRLPADDRHTAIALALILGGAVGNLVDRVRLGRVIDFIHLYYDRFHWPVFNVADIAITLGAILLALTTVFARKSATG